MVATPSKADPTDRTRQKMDCAMYSKSAAPPPDGCADWSNVELSVEMKVNKENKDDMFTEAWPHYPADSDKRKDNLGQVMSYSTLVFDRQHRTHHFTLVIIGSWARIIRWDRSVAVFTEKFDYKAEPHKLGRFLWCFSRLQPTQRGHDPTVTRVLPDSKDDILMHERAAQPRKVGGRAVDEHVRTAFKNSLKTDWPWYKMVVHDKTGDKELLVGKPNFIAAGLAGRGTRGYIAIDKADPYGPFVYLKDVWRVVHDRIQKEGDVLTELNTANVPYIPTLRYDGDVPGQRTDPIQRWKTLYGQKRGSPPKEPQCPLKIHQHYRMVVNEVGSPLSDFANGKELVQIMLDCLDGAWLAVSIQNQFAHTYLSAQRTRLPSRLGTSIAISAQVTSSSFEGKRAPRRPSRACLLTGNSPSE